MASVYSIEQGAWTWIHSTQTSLLNASNQLFLGACDAEGNQIVIQRDLLTGASVTTQVNADGTIDKDDHDQPAILRRSSDGKLVVAWCQHNINNDVKVRVSSNADDSTSWAAIQTYTTAVDTTSYTWLFEDSGGTIWLFYRIAGNGYYYRKSADGGASFGAETLFSDMGGDTHPGYPSISQNLANPDRLDFIFARVILGAPSAWRDLWHLYIDISSGTPVGYTSDGTLIAAGMPFSYSDGTQFYDSAVTTRDSWGWNSVSITASDIRLVFLTAPSAAQTTDHRYHHARWDGAAWSISEIDATKNSTGLATGSGQELYTPGICFSKFDYNKILCLYGGQTNGETGSEVTEYTTADNGATWTAGTQHLSKQANVLNMRPISPKGATAELEFLFMQGVYNGYVSYLTGGVIIHNSTTARITGYNYRMKLDIVEAQVSGVTPFPMFPVPLHKNLAGWDALFFTRVSSVSGSDLRLSYDAAGSQPIPFKIIDFSKANSRCALMATVGLLESGSSAQPDVYLFYGKAGDVAPGSTGMWDRSMKAVWLFNETSGVVQDHTSNDHDLTPTGSPVYSLPSPWGDAHHGVALLASAAAALDATGPLVSSDRGRTFEAFVKYASHSFVGNASNAWVQACGITTADTPYGVLSLAPTNSVNGGFTLSWPNTTGGISAAYAGGIVTGTPWVVAVRTVTSSINLWVNTATKLSRTVTNLNGLNTLRLGGVNRLNPAAVGSIKQYYHAVRQDYGIGWGTNDGRNSTLYTAFTTNNLVAPQAPDYVGPAAGGVGVAVRTHFYWVYG